MNTQQALELPASPLSNTVVINARCMLRTEETQRVILVAELSVYHFCAADAAAEAYAMVMLVESGFAQQRKWRVHSESPIALFADTRNATSRLE